MDHETEVRTPVSQDAEETAIELISTLPKHLRLDLFFVGFDKRIATALQSHAARPKVSQDSREGRQREHYCDKCEGHNIVWFVRNKTWNKVMPEGGIVCPVCFVEAAEALGIIDVWELRASSNTSAIDAARPVVAGKEGEGEPQA